MNGNNFVVQAFEHSDLLHGGDGGTTTVTIGVVETLEAGMQMLRDTGAKEGRVLQVFPPKLRKDGRLVPVPVNIFPYTVPPAKKTTARNRKS